MKSLLKKIISTILIWESKIVLKKYKPRIVAVTGTVGKTSTKDAIFTVLSSNDYVRRSDKSFNSEIGVPLTILGCQNAWSDPLAWLGVISEGIELILFKSNYPKCLVLEVGADHPGDIQSISKWLKTDVVVINKIGDVPVHVEFFPSPEDVVKEKASLITSLKPDGTLVLFADDKKVMALAEGVSQKVVTFGIVEVATVTATEPAVSYNEKNIPQGMSFNLNYNGTTTPVTIQGILGVQQIYPIIAGATIGIVRDVPLDKIIASFKKHVAPKGRMNIIAGLRGSTLIDDSYNSSPDALREGLNTLANLQVPGKKIAVLGDMMELGTFSSEEHRKAGVQALQGTDLLVTVGPRARLMSDKAVRFNASSEAAEFLSGMVSEGDMVFIKGSQSMRMERVTKALLADPSLAPKLLVRQEKEWLAKK